MYKHGDKVKTTQEYKRLFNRAIEGTVVVPPFATSQMREVGTFLICEKQSGNVIPEYQNQMVLIATRFLEPASLH